MTSATPQPLPHMPKIRNIERDFIASRMAFHKASFEIARNLDLTASAITGVSSGIDTTNVNLGKIDTTLDLKFSTPKVTVDARVDTTCQQDAMILVRILNALEDNIADAQNFSPIGQNKNYWRTKPDLKKHNSDWDEIMIKHPSLKSFSKDFLQLGTRVETEPERVQRLVDIQNFRSSVLSYLLSADCTSTQPSTPQPSS